MHARLLIGFVLLLSSTPAAQHVRGSLERLPPPNATEAPGLRVQLGTRDGRTAFHLYESIPLEVRINSSIAQAYSIELDHGWNVAATYMDFLISPSASVVKRSYRWGIVCCSSHRIFLTPVPEVSRYYLTDMVRFLRPGEYRIQFRSYAVFRGNGVRENRFHERGDAPAMSNVLTLTILPDDPQWDATTLQSALAVLDNVPVETIVAAERRRMERAFGSQRKADGQRLPGPVATRYFDAQRALAALDTDDAIRERVRRLVMPSEEEWRSSVEVGGQRGVDGRFVSLSTRPDALAAAMAARAAEPDFGVQYGFMDLWIDVLAQRDNPSLFSAVREDPPSGFSDADGDAYTQAAPIVAEALKRALEQKTGLAREMTAHTIGLLDRNLSRAR